MNATRKQVQFGALVTLEVGGLNADKTPRESMVVVRINGESHQISLLDADRIATQMRNAIKYAGDFA